MKTNDFLKHVASRRIKPCIPRACPAGRTLRLAYARRRPPVVHRLNTNIYHTVLNRQLVALQTIVQTQSAPRGRGVSLWHSTLLLPVVLRTAARQLQSDWHIRLLRPANAERTARVLAPAFTRMFRRRMEEEQRYYRTRPMQTRQLLWRLLGNRTSLHLLTRFYAGVMENHAPRADTYPAPAWLLPSLLEGAAGRTRNIAPPAVSTHLYYRHEQQALSYHHTSTRTGEAQPPASAQAAEKTAFAPQPQAAAHGLSEQEMARIVRHVFRELAQQRAHDRLRGKE